MSEPTEVRGRTHAKALRAKLADAGLGAGLAVGAARAAVRQGSRRAHPRYADCVAEMLAGRYRSLLFSRSAVEAALESRLELVPTSPPAPGARRGPAEEAA
jgi:hypothetical protein